MKLANSKVVIPTAALYIAGGAMGFTLAVWLVYWVSVLIVALTTTLKLSSDVSFFMTTSIIGAIIGAGVWGVVTYLDEAQ